MYHVTIDLEDVHPDSLPLITYVLAVLRASGVRVDNADARRYEDGAGPHGDGGYVTYDFPIPDLEVTLLLPT